MRTVDQLVIARVLLICGTLILSVNESKPQSQPAASSSDSESSLKTFLRGYLREKIPSPGDDTRYASAFVDLDGDGKSEAIVFVLGSDWCGTAGCNTYVLGPHGTSWRVVGRILGSSDPIRVLNARSNGWRNISVWTRNPGSPSYEVELRFNGKRYPLSPKIPVGQDEPGEVVISSPPTTTFLYQKRSSATRQTTTPPPKQ